MSIVPAGTSSSSDPRHQIWDPLADFQSFLFSSVWDPFGHHSFPFPAVNYNNTRLDWRETPSGHVLKALLPGGEDDHVLVGLVDDDHHERVLQISTESGSLLSRFRLPVNADISQLHAFMDPYGILTVTVPKVGPAAATMRRSGNNNVRVIDISGD